jgi:exopolysaccharide biosynthesis polyprenyl glycosylphosphotransferase
LVTDKGDGPTLSLIYPTAFESPAFHKLIKPSWIFEIERADILYSLLCYIAINSHHGECFTMKSVLSSSFPVAQKNSLFSTKQISRPVQWRLYIATIFVTDILMVYFSLWLAYVVRFTVQLPIFHLDVVPYTELYLLLFLLCIPVFISTFIMTGMYNRRNLLGGTSEYALIFKATSISLFLLIVAGFLDPTFVIARGWLLIAWIFSFSFLASSRFTLRRIVYNLRKRGYFVSPALVVGANDEGMTLAKQLRDWSTSGLNVIGFVDKKLPAGSMLFDGLQVLGDVDDLDHIIERYHVEEIILATSAISSRDKMLEIFQKYGVSSGINLRLSSGLYEIITTGLTINEFAYVPLVYVNKVRLKDQDRIIKALMDYAITIPGLILISPLLLAIAIAIKLDSPGPVLYRRRVLGISGTQFDALKFRTMHAAGDKILEDNPELKNELDKNHKLKNDPRVTRLGKFLRKTSLDELPQLFNVLLREMSVVGPRMISPEEVKEYNRLGLNLLTVHPGITGLWQVSGRSDITYQERVRLDMHYIRNWSIWLDIQLLFRTIPAVLKSRGAY